MGKTTPSRAAPSGHWNPSPLTWVISGSTIAAVAVGIAMAWSQLFPPPPERVVDVYHTSTCSCAPAWIRALEADGFVVRTSSTETLRKTRRALNIPPMLQGCHVGVYLKYFLEGHVAPEAGRDLATHRPAGKGLVTKAALMAAQLHGPTIDQNSPVLLLSADGSSTSVWYRPES